MKVEHREAKLKKTKKPGLGWVELCLEFRPNPGAESRRLSTSAPPLPRSRSVDFDDQIEEIEDSASAVYAGVSAAVSRQDHSAALRRVLEQLGGGQTKLKGRDRAQHEKHLTKLFGKLSDRKGRAMQQEKLRRLIDQSREHFPSGVEQLELAELWQHLDIDSDGVVSLVRPAAGWASIAANRRLRGRYAGPRCR